MINTGRLTAPEGYEVSVPGDVLATPGTGLNVEVRKVVTKAILVISFETADGEKVGESISVTSDDELIEYGKDYNLPEGYTFADDYKLKDIPVTLGTTGGHTVKVKLVEETIEVTFIDEETKAPVGEKINVEVKDGMINTGRLTAPEGYEVCVPGDVLATPGAGLNVEVRKVAAKTVEVTFIDEETKAPVGEKINVEVKDGMINTGRLTAPEGYEVCVPGDVLATAGAGLNVEVRKVAAKTVEVTFIDEETKAPVGEKINVEVKDGMINTGRLTAPEGYEVCVPGDVLATAGAGLNVEVRKVAAKTVEVTFIDEETKAPVGEKINVEVKDGMINTGRLTAPEGYEVCVPGDVLATAGAGLNVEVRKVAAKTVEVTFIDEETKAPVGEKINVEVKDGMINTGRLTAPEGYEVCVPGDVLATAGAGLNVEVRKVAAKTVEVTFIDEETKAPVGEKINVEVKDGMINTGRLTAPEGYEVCVPGDVLATPGAGLNVEVRKVAAKTVEVTFIDEETKAPVGEKINVEVKDGMINTGRLTAPEGYEVCVPGDVLATAGAGLNVEVRKVAAKTVEVTFIDEETKAPVGEKINVEVKDGMINTGRLTAPEGYEVCVPGDVLATAGAGLNVEVRKVAAKTVEVTFIDEETKEPVGEKVNVEVKDGMINTGRLTAPEGYEVCVPGDVLATAGAGLNVEVRKVAAKTVEVTFIDEETKAPVGEKINVEVKDGMINTGRLTAPEGYEVCVKGDVLATAGAGLNVEVRKVAKTVYVSYIDADTKMPLENAIETLKLEAGATYFNASVLKAIPEGYELVTTGDVFVGNNDTVNVEVRKAEKTVYVSYIDADTKMPLENAIETIKLAANVTYFNTNMLKAIPEGYTLAVAGDVFVGNNDTVNVEVRKAEKTVYVSYIDEETKMPFENGIEEIKVPADANSFNTSILKNVPAGYELCVVGDVTFEGDSLNVEVRKAEKTVYVSYIDEETKMPFENGIEEIKLAADANSFNTSILKNVPAGYELCVVGDVTFEGDSLNVEVRKAEKTVYVSYIDEETKMPFENGIEEIKVPADANSFNTSILKNVPAGYELCVVGDIAFEGDSLNVEVRKVVNFEYVKVTYVDADNGEFVVGYGTAKVEKGAAYFNTSTLTDVPYGYEIAEAGDMVIANGEATVKVRKIDNVQEVTITYVHKTTGDVVGYGKLNAYKDETYFNTSRLTDIPEGYVLADVGDMPIENGAATVYVYAATDMEETSAIYTSRAIQTGRTIYTSRAI